jgi:hypothetical protein
VIRGPAFALVLVATTGAWGGGPDVLRQVADAAVQAQTACYRQIHHDTFEFEDCLKALLVAEKKPTPRRLGIEYFGFVGALNSSRMGMLGSADTAADFLRRYRVTQRKLKLDDAALCATIAGDCVVRTARMKQMEDDPRPRDATAAQARQAHEAGAR